MALQSVRRLNALIVGGLFANAAAGGHLKRQQSAVACGQPKAPTKRGCLWAT